MTRFADHSFFIATLIPLAAVFVVAQRSAPSKTSDDLARRASVLLVGGPTAVVDLGGASAWAAARNISLVTRGLAHAITPSPTPGKM